jgi:hypothetical protein
VSVFIAAGLNATCRVSLDIADGSYAWEGIAVNGQGMHVQFDESKNPIELTDDLEFVVSVGSPASTEMVAHVWYYEW